MGSRSPLTFGPDELRVLSSEQYAHPDRRVQRRMEVLWLISQGETQDGRPNWVASRKPRSSGMSRSNGPRGGRVASVLMGQAGQRFGGAPALVGGVVSDACHTPWPKRVSASRR
jgi:hypothetical protein